MGNLIGSNLEKDDFLSISKKRILKLQVYQVACSLINDSRTVRGRGPYGNETIFDETLWREKIEYLKNCSIYQFVKNSKVNETKQEKETLTSYITGDYHCGRYTFASTIIRNIKKPICILDHRGYGVEYKTVKYKIGEDEEYEHGLFYPAQNSRIRAFKCRTIPILFSLENAKSFEKVLEIYNAKKKELSEYGRIGEFVLIGNKADKPKREISREIAEQFAFEKMDGSLYFEHSWHDVDQPHRIMLYMFLMGKFILPFFGNCNN